MLDIKEIMKILPHRYPIALVDRVEELNIGESIKAYKNVTMNEPIFQGHFPGHPIYPGVMILEGMAQAGGILAFKSLTDINDFDDKVVYFMSIDKAKFRKPVTPGDKLIYDVKVIKARGAVYMFKAEAYVDGELVSEAELKAMVVDK
jgi:3-hydroxyacyl-[acyl-carrier-protein] dehydratase